MIDDIKCVFEKFGKLNSVEIRQTKEANFIGSNLVHYGLVEFETVEGVDAVLSNELLRIVDCDFQVYKPKTLRYSNDDRKETEVLEMLKKTQRFMSGLKKPEIGSASDFTQLNQQYTSVYLTNFNIPIRTLYIAPVNVDVSIPFCNVVRNYIAQSKLIIIIFFNFVRWTIKSNPILSNLVK